MRRREFITLLGGATVELSRRNIPFVKYGGLSS
jgi:hypothetical protein